MRIGDIAQKDAKFFLKSEYGALHSGWPVVAFTQKSFETQLRAKYRTGRDFVVYLGTSGEETPERDRGRLISLAEVDLTKTYATYDFLADEDRSWAEAKYPGRWLHCFRVLRGFDLPQRPNGTDVLRNTDCTMWHVPFREVDSQDLASVADIEIEPILDVDILSRPGRRLDHSDLLRPENQVLSKEALRLAQLVFNRVSISGAYQTHKAPMRSAPTDLQVQILALLMANPLRCALCSGAMQISVSNKLLQISGDRNDSKIGSYGPENYQLVHLACNYAKNDATQAEFMQWLESVREASITAEEGSDDF